MAEVDEELEQRMKEYAGTAVGTLEDMRALARDASKFLHKSGVPSELHWESIQILERIESLESRVSEYAVEVAQ